MKLRSILLVSVGAALLAAGAAVAGTAGAKKSPEIALAETAYEALTAGRSADAIADYTQAIESRKLPAELLANALLNRALAHQNVGKHRNAIDDYAAALRMDAMSPRLRAVALYNRGLSQHKLNQPAAAIEDFTSALFLDPEFAEAYLSRANMLRQTGQFLFALGDYEKALRYSHPEPHLPLYGQALTYEALSQTLLAQQALARAIKVSPDFLPAREKLVELGARPADVDTLAEAEAPRQAGLIPLADGIMTASLADPGADFVMTKTDLPGPASPPEALLEAETEPSKPAVPEPEKTEAAAADVAEPEPQAETDVAAAEPQPEAEPEPRATVLEGWTVQLSSQRNEAAAWSVWEKLSQRHRELLAGRDAAVVRADLGTKGVYYRLRIHRLESRNEARSLCSRLKSNGTACFFGRAES